MIWAIWLISIWTRIGSMHMIVCHHPHQLEPNRKMTMICWAWNRCPIKCLVHHKLLFQVPHQIAAFPAIMLICKYLLGYPKINRCSLFFRPDVIKRKDRLNWGDQTIYTKHLFWIGYLLKSFLVKNKFKSFGKRIRVGKTFVFKSTKLLFKII